VVGNRFRKPAWGVTASGFDSSGIDPISPWRALWGFAYPKCFSPRRGKKIYVYE